MSFLALVEPGAHFCILNADVASFVQDQLGESIGEVVLRTAHGLVDGRLYTHRIQLIADQGDHLTFDCTIFLSPRWQGSNFLGYVQALCGL